MRNESHFFWGCLSILEFFFVAVLGLEPRVGIIFTLSKDSTTELHSHSLNAVFPLLCIQTVIYKYVAILLYRTIDKVIV